MPRKKHTEEGSDGAQEGPFADENQEGADPEAMTSPGENPTETPAENPTENLDESPEDDLQEGEPDNLAPQTKKRAKEARMAAEGELRSVRIAMRRLTPEKIKHEGQELLCQGQRKVVEGQFTREEIEILALDYFGGGRINVNIIDVDSGKLKTRYFLQFPGVPNIANIITDCYGGDVQVASQTVGGIGLIPSSVKPRIAEPVTDEERRLRELEAKRAELRKQREIKQAERELADEERQAELEERERRKDQEREEAIERQRELEEADRRAGELGMPLPSMLAQQRQGRFGRQGYQDRLNMDDPDRPLTPRQIQEEFSRQRESDQLREQIRRLEDLVRSKNDEPKSNAMMEIMATMMSGMQAANAQIIAAITSASKKPEGENERWMTLFKLMADSNKSEKTVDLVVKAAGLQEDRKSNEMANVLKFLELGMQVGREGGGPEEEGEWWHGPLRGIGDILSAAAQRLGVGQQGPPVMLRPGPGAGLPLPGQVALQPGATQHALPPPVAAARAAAAAGKPPAPAAAGGGVPAVRLPGAETEQIKQGIAEQEDEMMSPDQQLKNSVGMIMQTMLEQADTMPAKPDWVDAAFETLPFAMLKIVAESKSYNELIEQFKPHADALLGAKLMMRIQGDKRMIPWLIMGYEQLRDMAQDQVDEMEERMAEAQNVELAQTPAPEAPAAPAAVPSDVQPLKEEGVEGGKSDARA